MVSFPKNLQLFFGLFLILVLFEETNATYNWFFKSEKEQEVLNGGGPCLNDTEAVKIPIKNFDKTLAFYMPLISRTFSKFLMTNYQEWKSMKNSGVAEMFSLCPRIQYLGGETILYSVRRQEIFLECSAVNSDKISEVSCTNEYEGDEIAEKFNGVRLKFIWADKENALGLMCMHQSRHWAVFSKKSEPLSKEVKDQVKQALKNLGIDYRKSDEISYVKCFKNSKM